LDVSLCTKTAWTHGTADDAKKKNNLGSDVCLLVKDWTIALVTDRYDTNCANNAAIVTKFTNLKNFYTDMNTKMDAINTSLGNIKTKNTAYLNKFDTYITKVTGLKTDITGLLDLISDPKIGLLAGLNCTFLKANF